MTADAGVAVGLAKFAGGDAVAVPPDLPPTAGAFLELEFGDVLLVHLWVEVVVVGAVPGGVLCDVSIEAYGAGEIRVALYVVGWSQCDLFALCRLEMHVGRSDVSTEMVLQFISQFLGVVLGPVLGAVGVAGVVAPAAVACVREEFL